MSKSTLILATLCLVAAGFAVAEASRARTAESILGLAEDEGARQEKRAAAAEDRNRELRREIEELRADLESARAAAEAPKAIPGTTFRPEGAVSVSVQPWAAPPGWSTPAEPANTIPASQIMPTQQMTPLSAEVLAQRVEAARLRNEITGAVTAADLTMMPAAYEWGTGAGRRIWRLMDPNTYYEIYPDGKYSVIPIVGRTVLDGVPGVITTKDDGVFDIFIPDKGGRMVHRIRGTGGRGGAWMDYTAMDKVE